MSPTVFAALTGFWQLCGGHVTLGSFIALIIARAYFVARSNFFAAVVLYYTICLILWAIGDWLFGPFAALSTTVFPHY